MHPSVAKGLFRAAWRGVRKGNGKPGPDVRVPFHVAHMAIIAFQAEGTGDWFYRLRNRAVRRIYGERLHMCPQRLRLRRLDALDIGEPS